MSAGSIVDDNIFSLTSDFSTYLRSGTVVPFSNGFSLGLGLIWHRQVEVRSATYGINSTSIENEFIKNENAISVSMGKQLTRNTSIGLAVKNIYQHDDLPSHIDITTMTFTDDSTRTSQEIIKNTFRKSITDFDISMSHTLAPHAKLGLNLMNINGSKIHTNTSEESLRALGVGVVLLDERFNYGWFSPVFTDTQLRAG